MNYVFNYDLFSSLPAVCHLPATTLSRMTGVPYPSWRWYIKKKKLPLMTLVKICNTLRFPIAYFIIPENNEKIIVGQYQDYTVSEKDYQPVEFRHLEMGYALTSASIRTVEQASQAIGVSPQTFRRNFRSPEPPAGLFIDDYLRFCNLAKIYPGEYLVDFNHKIGLIEGFHRGQMTTLQRLESQLQQIADLSKENSRLVTFNQKLLSENKNLKAKVKQLEMRNGQVEEEGTRSIADEQAQNEADNGTSRGKIMDV